ncbi:MAG: RHS repeat-associated core domain-containing protein, partial [Planctomycetes bacterium]|nr:RHS repeat-associated core domain-containing protein [Planctomycetota bacterium]
MDCFDIRVNAITHIYKFTGREYCEELGIYYYRARWYDPGSGRFISQDPIGFEAGDPNLYRYVGNAPGDGTDPSGLAKINLGNIKDGRVPVGYQGSWILFYGSEEFIGYLDPKNNSVERNGKLVSLNKLERIASSWWG